MPQDPVMDILEDLLKFEDIYACMVARKNMISVMPDREKFNPKIMDTWDIIHKAMDDLFVVIKEYSRAGLGEMEFRLQDYDVLFYIFPETENALVVIVPALSNRGLLEVQLEKARRKIVEIIE